MRSNNSPAFSKDFPPEQKFKNANNWGRSYTFIDFYMLPKNRFGTLLNNGKILPFLLFDLSGIAKNLGKTENLTQRTQIHDMRNITISLMEEIQLHRDLALHVMIFFFKES